MECNKLFCPSPPENSSQHKCSQTYLRQPRFLVRCNDMIKVPPSAVRPENKSLYRRTFKGELLPRPPLVRPHDQGINGLETDEQLSNPRNESAIQNRLHFPQSTYKDDFNEEIFKKCHNELQLCYPTHNCANTDDQKLGYHTWVRDVPPNHIKQRVGYDWVPKPAVYLNPDPSKLVPMQTDTSYQMHYRHFDGYYLGKGAKPDKNLACHSDIAEQKLLNSVNGICEKLPNTLYRDSFVGQIGVDNWSNRNYCQNTSAITSRTGRPHNNDQVYWMGVDTVPFEHCTKSLFEDIK